MDIFEQASRQKLRFETKKGFISVEDLWDLPLTSPSGRLCLDDIARNLFKQIEDKGNISFVTENAPVDQNLQLAFDIVKHVIGALKAEHKASTESREKKETKQRIMAILAERKDQDLRSKSVEELENLIDNL